MPQIPMQQDDPAVTDEEIWAEAATRLKIGIEAESQNRTKGQESLEFLDGHQWPDDLYNQRKIAKRPSLTINHTRTFRNRVVNNMKQQRPRVKVHPVAEADIDKAQVVEGLLRHIWNVSNADIAIDCAGSSAVDIGWGYARIVADYIDGRSMDQEIKILPIRNSFTVYMDPSSVMPAGEDAEWVIITEKMKRSEFKRRFPKQELNDFQRTGIGDFQSMWETKTEIRLAEYYRISKKSDQLIEMSDGSLIYRSELSKNKQLADSMGLTIIRERPSYRLQVEWYLLTGTKVVDRKPIPGTFIPVCRCEGNVLDLNGQVRRKGMIEDLMDPARMFNYWRHLSIDTPLPTPSGWTTMGAVQTGDLLFNEQGQPCKVLGKSPVYIGKDCYRITFDDGQIVASDEHEWQVEERGKRVTAGWTWQQKPLQTKDLIPGKHFVATTAPLDLPTQRLPIDPYLLGVWLGDGSSAEPQICQGDGDMEPMRANIAALGLKVGQVRRYGDKVGVFTIHGVRKAFAAEKLLANKHIPAQYLRASRQQRMALLQGLMDTDGSSSVQGQCSFTNTNPAIAQGFAQLLRSLGIKALHCVRSGRVRKFADGRTSLHQDAYQFSFTTREPVFRLERKLANLGKRGEEPRRTKRHRIIKVERIKSVPVQCLAIDSPSHLFLAGEAMIPTHNTAETEQLALSSKAPWVGPAGFMDGHPEWANANQQPYSALEYEPVYFENPDGSKQPLPAPMRQPAIEVPAGFVQAAQSAQQDLMAVAGMPHEPGQDSPGAVVSGVALQRRQALSDIGHFQYYDNQTRFIRQIGRICLDWLPVYYSSQRMQRIIGEDGVPSMQPINTPQPNPENPAVMAVKNDLTVGRYDVVMDTGPGYDTKRLESAETMIDLLKTPLAEPIAKVGADLVVRNMDFAGASDLADRLMPMTPQGLEKTLQGLPKSAQGVVTAMSQHMQQLQQKIQEQAMEIKYKTTIEHGWMQVEREKTKEKQSADAANNAAKEFDTHVKSITARDVAEINAGAKLLDTHVKGAHAARKDEMAAAEKASESSL